MNVFLMVLGMRSISISELIEIDRTYPDRMEERMKAIDQHENSVIGCQPSVETAARELYAWLVNVYLPRRFPSIFQVERADIETSGLVASTIKYPCLRNLVTQHAYPLQSPPSPQDALKTIGGLVDEDMLLMPPLSDNNGYTLQAFVNCFENVQTHGSVWI